MEINNNINNPDGIDENLNENISIKSDMTLAVKELFYDYSNDDELIAFSSIDIDEILDY